MEFRLIGPLEAEHDGRLLELGRRRERCLLGLLLLEPNTPLTTDRLVNLLWDEEPPSAARSSLHTHVSRLRSRLDPDGTGRCGIRLISSGGGYLAQVDPRHIDVHRFLDLIRRAGGASPAAGADLFREALKLWRGPLLGDVASPRLRERVGAELTELKLTATESMVEAELALGRHRELIGELSVLSAEHPYRERLTGQLMLALYRSDRYVDALTVYRRLRDRLGETLGVDPGPYLQGLHTAILRRDPHLASHDPAGAATASAPPAALDAGADTGADGDGFRTALPRQLPAAPGVFAGRSGELSILTKTLTDRDERRGVAIAAIGGSGGVGKTWLALHWAHLHVDAFPDGQLFVNLRGFDPSSQPTTPATAVRGFLDALGVLPSELPADPEAQVGMYRSLVDGRRLLIVLDNARDASQVENLLPGSASCAVIVTSRNQLTGLISRYGAHPVSLDVLDGAAAREMLAMRIGEEPLAAEPDAAAALLAACAGLPLAVGIAAARVALRPDLGLAVIAEQMRDAATRLDALDENDTLASLRAVLSWSYEALSAAHARVFGLLGLAVGPDLSLAAAAALTGLAPDQIAATLRMLERQSLIQQHTPGRWRMHDLVRLYAGESAVRDQSEDARRRALRATVDFYLHTAYAADRLLSPHRPSIAIAAPVPGGEPQTLPDRASAEAWFDAEHECLLSVQQLAVEQGRHEAAWQLAWSLNTYHHRRVHLRVQAAMWQIGLAATAHANDPVGQTQAHRFLGRVHSQSGHHAQAADHLYQALALAERSGDLTSQAYCHLALGSGWHLRGDDSRALEHATRTLELDQNPDDVAYRAVVLNAVGWYAARVGRYGLAETRLHEALALHRLHDDRSYEADTLDSLGYLTRHTGRPAESARYYQRALELQRAVGDHFAEADTLDHIADAHAAAGELEYARSAWNAALRLFRTQRRTADADRIQRQLDRLGTD